MPECLRDWSLNDWQWGWREGRKGCESERVLGRHSTFLARWADILNSKLDRSLLENDYVRNLSAPERLPIVLSRWQMAIEKSGFLRNLLFLGAMEGWWWVSMWKTGYGSLREMSHAPKTGQNDNFQVHHKLWFLHDRRCSFACHPCHRQRSGES